MDGILPRAPRGADRSVADPAARRDRHGLRSHHELDHAVLRVEASIPSAWASHRRCAARCGDRRDWGRRRAFPRRSRRSPGRPRAARARACRRSPRRCRPRLPAHPASCARRLRRCWPCSNSSDSARPAASTFGSLAAEALMQKASAATTMRARSAGDATRPQAAQRRARRSVQATASSVSSRDDVDAGVGERATQRRDVLVAGRLDHADDAHRRKIRPGERAVVHDLLDRCAGRRRSPRASRARPPGPIADRHREARRGGRRRRGRPRSRGRAS